LARRSFISGTLNKRRCRRRRRRRLARVHGRHYVIAIMPLYPNVADAVRVTLCEFSAEIRGKH